MGNQFLWKNTRNYTACLENPLCQLFRQNVRNKNIFTMSDFLKTSQFLFCVVGIYVCFLTWAVLQERLTSVSYKAPSEAPKKFKYFVFLNMIQSVTASVIAAIYLLLRGQKLHHVSWSLLLEYSKVAFSSTIASPFGYASLKHINYPTMVS